MEREEKKENTVFPSVRAERGSSGLGPLIPLGIGSLASEKKLGSRGGERREREGEGREGTVLGPGERKDLEPEIRKD